MIIGLDDWLYHWADWARRHQNEALGYPSKTVEYELWRMGGVLIRGEGGAPRVSMDPDVAEAMDALQDLQREKVNHWYVVRAHYYDGGKTNRAKSVIASRWIGRPISLRTYDRVLSEARAWLEEWRVRNNSCRRGREMLQVR